MKKTALASLIAGLVLIITTPIVRAAGLDPDRVIDSNLLQSLVTDKTWYGWAVTGQYSWVEYYSPNGDAFYTDDNGFLQGTWTLRGEREICFDYPSLGTFCFAARETASGQVAIYDLTDERLIHITTRIVSGDTEGLRSLSVVAPGGEGEEVGRD